MVGDGAVTKQISGRMPGSEDKSRELNFEYMGGSRSSTIAHAMDFWSWES